MKGTVFTLNNSDFESQYRGNETPRRLRLDTKYGLAFRYCLTDLMLEATRRLRTHKRFSEARMHVVLESGHPNGGDALRIFAEMQREMQGLGSSLLSSLTFADKRRVRSPDGRRFPRAHDLYGGKPQSCVRLSAARNRDASTARTGGKDAARSSWF